MQKNWTLRLITALLWAAAACAAVYWGLRFSSTPEVAVPPVADVAPATDLPARQNDIARFLGATPATALPSEDLIPKRFSLVGVVTSGDGGAALLTVDDEPAKPYRVGSKIGDSLVLQSVSPRQAVLAASMDGPPLQRLDLRPPAPSAPAQAAPPALPPQKPAVAAPAAQQAAPAAQPDQGQPASLEADLRRPDPGVPQPAS